MNPAPRSRWYFGWNIVAAAAMLTLLSTGMRLGIGPFKEFVYATPIHVGKAVVGEDTYA